MTDQNTLPKDGKNMTSLTIPIGGMSCGGCVAGVKAALATIPGVAEADVRVGEAKVQYDPARTNPDALRDAITRAGYVPAVSGGPAHAKP
jgi:copper chaperone